MIQRLLDRYQAGRILPHKRYIKQTILPECPLRESQMGCLNTRPAQHFRGNQIVRCQHIKMLLKRFSPIYAAKRRTIDQRLHTVAVLIVIIIVNSKHHDICVFLFCSLI